MVSTYDKVKALADEQKRSIASLEKDAGVANGTIGGWRDGKPYADTLNKIATVLGVTMDELMGDSQ